MLRSERCIAARPRRANDIAVLFWTGGTAARNPATSRLGRTHTIVHTCMYMRRIYPAVNSKYVHQVHSDELSRRIQFHRRFLFVRATKPAWLGKRREFRPYTKYFHIPFATAAPFSSSLALLFTPSVACLRPLLLYGRYQRVLGFIRRNENFALPPFPQREEEKQFKFRSFIKRNVSLSFSHSSPPSRYFHPRGPPL